MKITYTLAETVDIAIYQAFGIDLRKALFFDIETTGFAASNTILYLIGICYYEEKSNSFKGIQWFNKDGTKEAEILKEFIETAKQYSYLIHYNGDGFDIPYLKEKAKQFQIPWDIYIDSFDIYKQCRSIRHLLALDHIKQKNIETFLNIERKDQMNGGELIKVYQNYLKFPTQEAQSLLLLHNSDDMRGLLKITPILSYVLLVKKQYTLSHLTIKENTAIFSLTLNYPLKRRVSKGKDEITFSAFQNAATLRIPVYSGELKYFYPNYKDYYYLPLEDTAMHKSVAFYVDKEYRTQAKAANCYSKKTGMFLPQKEEIVSPYFKKEYNDKISYFELTEEICQDHDKLKEYATSILAAILK